MGINKNIFRNIDVDRKSTNIKNGVVCDKSTHVKYNTNIDIELIINYMSNYFNKYRYENY